MPRCYFTTYDPLLASRAGSEASVRFGIPPFVDGSIRREPDLEHRYPSISCLCRAGKFAPRLQPRDLVACLTRKRRGQWRLTAVLQVLETFASHREAAEWYRIRKCELPSNCMVPGNPARPLECSHRMVRGVSCLNDALTARHWDAQYRVRARQHQTFVVCEPLFRHLAWDAPIVDDEDFLASLGRVPGMQNPGAIGLGEFVAFLRRMGVSIRSPKQ